MKQVSKDWFKGDAIDIAKGLLGKIIKYKGCSGMIVETEAYKSDPASHAYKITPRSEIMHVSYGKFYVYHIYGMYFCLNITTNKGEAGAVLIRGVEPIEGIAKMKKRRGTDDVHNLTSGPGKLCQAFGITKANLNCTDVNKNMKVLHHKRFKEDEIAVSKRIGIKEGTELDWRFYVKGNGCVSR